MYEANRAMDIGKALALAGSAISVAVIIITVLSWLRISPDGPRMIGKLWARLTRRRRAREAQQQRILELEQQYAELQNLVTNLLLVVAADSRIMVFNHTPEAQYVREAAQAAKERTNGKTTPRS